MTVHSIVNSSFWKNFLNLVIKLLGIFYAKNLLLCRNFVEKSQKDILGILQNLNMYG